MKLSAQTIKAIQGLRATHWDQLLWAIERASDTGAYYGPLAAWGNRMVDLQTIARMALRDKKPDHFRLKKLGRGRG
jgi:hypothetical protein